METPRVKKIVKLSPVEGTDPVYSLPVSTPSGTRMPSFSLKEKKRLKVIALKLRSLLETVESLISPIKRNQ